jgi:hypothetical protein
MKILLQATVDYEYLTGAVGKDNQKAAEEILSLPVQDNMAVTEEHCQHMDRLWRDDAVQRAWAIEGKLAIEGSMPYFMDKILEIGKFDYVPTVDDILRARKQTTSVNVHTFQVEQGKDFHFKCVDVSGQRSERKKWISHFDDVDAILFVASLSEYDKIMREDSSTNRMLDSNKLFEDICKSPFFRDVHIMLFLNKDDVFREKIAKIDLNICYPEYTGGKDYEVSTFRCHALLYSMRI